MAKLKVTCSELTPSHDSTTKVFLNDADITKSVQELIFHWGVGTVNTAELKFLVDEADIDTEALLRLKAYVDGRVEEHGDKVDPALISDRRHG